MNRRRAAERVAITDSTRGGLLPADTMLTANIDTSYVVTSRQADLLGIARERAVGPNGTQPLPFIPARPAPVGPVREALRIARRFVTLLVLLAALWLGVIVGAVELYRHPAVLDGIVVGLCVALMVAAIYVVHDRTHWWQDDRDSDQWLRDLRAALDASQRPGDGS